MMHWPHVGSKLKYNGISKLMTCSLSRPLSCLTECFCLNHWDQRLCYGSSAIIKIITLTVRKSTTDVRIWRLQTQILTSKVDPRNVRVNFTIYLCARGLLDIIWRPEVYHSIRRRILTFLSPKYQPYWLWNIRIWELWTNRLWWEGFPKFKNTFHHRF